MRVRRIQESVTPSPPRTRRADAPATAAAARSRCGVAASATADGVAVIAAGRDDAQLQRPRQRVEPARDRHDMRSSSTNGAPAASGSAIAHSLPACPRSSRDSS